MTKEIDRAGIPIVHICNLINISGGMGTNRLFQGNSVLHPLGNPALPPESEDAYRVDLVKQALKLLEE